MSNLLASVTKRWDRFGRKVISTNAKRNAFNTVREPALTMPFPAETNKLRKFAASRFTGNGEIVGSAIGLEDRLWALAEDWR